MINLTTELSSLTKWEYMNESIIIMTILLICITIIVGVGIILYSNRNKKEGGKT